jgi:hypothetical protein
VKVRSHSTANPGLIIALLTLEEQTPIQGNVIEDDNILADKNKLLNEKNALEFSGTPYSLKSILNEPFIIGTFRLIAPAGNDCKNVNFSCLSDSLQLISLNTIYHIR